MEVDGLDRDQRLVMVHAECRIVGSARLGMKHRVGRDGTARVDPCGAQLGDSRLDDLDLFAPQTTGFARMRVEPGDRENRSGDPEVPPQRRLGDAACMKNRRGAELPDRSAQREMNGYRYDTQPRADEHHHRCFADPGKSGQILGVSWIPKAGAVKAVLVYRIGDERCRVPGQHVTDPGLDRAEDSRRIRRIGVRRQGPQGDADRGDRESFGKYRRRVFRSADRLNRYRPTETASQRYDTSGVVDQVESWNTVAAAEPRLKGDFTTDS